MEGKKIVQNLKMFWSLEYFCQKYDAAERTILEEMALSRLLSSTFVTMYTDVFF